MILSQNRKRSTEFRSEFWLLGGLIALLLGGLVYILLNYRYQAVSLDPGSSVLCDAERVRGGHFIRDNFQFDKGEYQSNEVARSGWFSCRVPAGDGAQYGFGYRLESGQPGEVYRVTVWRYKNTLNEGKLAVSGTGPVGFYHESAEVMTQEGDWEQLSITFHIPYQSEIEYTNIYVYTNGYQPVFFDDLQIERIDFWEEKDFQPEILEMDIGPNGRQDLADKRQEAIRKGVLFSEADDWVNARIDHSGEGRIPVRVRLKGDWLDHLGGDKWSYRLKVRDPYEWKHLKEFSLHTPAARYHLHEWALHQLWEQEDVLTTRYDFVELKIDGVSRGIYAYEEHFTKQLIESRRRREGPILKFDEEGLWLAYQRQLEANGFIMFGHTPSAAAWGNADITAFDADEIAPDTTLGPLLRQARELLSGYFAGKLPAGQVFDLDRMAAYYAACDALNGYHGIVWHNQRFYFNPITTLLEPIGFDGFGGPPADASTFLGEGALNPQSQLSDNFFRRLARDTAFTRSYLNKLYRFTAPEFFEPFLDSIRQGWTARKTWLKMEFPGYNVELKDLRERARFVHTQVMPYDGQSVKVQRLTGASSKVQLLNTHTLPVEVIGWSSQGGKMRQIEKPVVLPGQIPRAYLNRLRSDSLSNGFAGFRFLEDQAMREQGVATFDTITLPVNASRIYFRPLGLDTLFSSELFWETTPVTPDYADLFKGRSLEESPFYVVEGKIVLFKPGNHRVTKHLYIPAGYRVEIPAGTSLDLVEGAALVSRSPVNATGEAEAPIRIYSSDGSGNGLTVLNAGTTSVFKNVDFQGLNTLQTEGWHLTGAVSFYESPVRFYRCRFIENHCEDALNIIRSEFQLEACRFDQIFSDGFDSDFSKGEVRNCAFFRTGNDGLDVSGSVVNVFECQFDTNGDKGISVGEASDLTVFNSTFKNAPIALASKDESTLYVRNVTLEDCDQGFAAFQKKPEYGGATILVDGYKAERVKRLFVEGEGSRVQIGAVE